MGRSDGSVPLSAGGPKNMEWNYRTLMKCGRVELMVLMHVVRGLFYVFFMFMLLVIE